MSDQLALRLPDRWLGCRRSDALQQCLRQKDNARALQAFDDLTEPLPHLLGNMAEIGIVNRLHRGHRINRRDLDPARLFLLEDHIAGQHGADLVLVLQRLIGKLGIAG